mmetsp:Transcript_6936/g.16213  ORF Transcript_6936/g.16213 Transcript_6936/m.16213 type:complete len:261 (+) Transcript_6936:1118-1900(+)
MDIVRKTIESDNVWISPTDSLACRTVGIANIGGNLLDNLNVSCCSLLQLVLQSFVSVEVFNNVSNGGGISGIFGKSNSIEDAKDILVAGLLDGFISLVHGGCHLFNIRVVTDIKVIETGIMFVGKVGRGFVGNTPVVTGVFKGREETTSAAKVGRNGERISTSVHPVITPFSIGRTQQTNEAVTADSQGVGDRKVTFVAPTIDIHHHLDLRSARVLNSDSLTADIDLGLVVSGSMRKLAKLIIHVKLDWTSIDDLGTRLI